MTIGSLSAQTKQAIRKILYTILPLNNRKQLAVWTDQQRWIPNCNILSMTIIRDWAEKDNNAFHLFLWTQHLGYAKFNEITNDYGADNLILTRRMLFEEIKKCLLFRSGTMNVDSVFEVGCSSGYLLRYIETDLFPRAKVLDGIDIDNYSLEKGRAYLQACKSKIRLIHADMRDLDNVMKGDKYDLILCAGVLMYLDEQAAASVVKSMLSHSKVLVAIACLAHPTIDNSKLERSEPRKLDGALMHNIDAMVQKVGGTIVHRRWEGARTFDGQRIYFIFCSPRTSLIDSQQPVSTENREQHFGQDGEGCA